MKNILYLFPCTPDEQNTMNFRGHNFQPLLKEFTQAGNIKQFLCLSEEEFVRFAQNVYINILECFSPSFLVFLSIGTLR